MIIIEAIIYVCLLTALLFVCDNQYSKKYYVPVKGACSASFLIICLISILFHDKPMGLFIPLMACFIGDIFMGLYNVYAKKRFIYGGIVSFILAHVCFINYLVARDGGDISPALFVIPFLMILVLYHVYKRCHLHMGKLLYAGMIYCFFVTSMTVEGFRCGGPAMIAGTLFFLSDFSIMFLYFYHFKKKRDKKIVHYFNLVTYYFAILIFCLF